MYKRFDTDSHRPDNRERRRLLRRGFHGLGLLACSGLIPAYRYTAAATERLSVDSIRLGKPDANGLRLPDGYTSRIIARSGQPVLEKNSYSWHAAPDGGAVFADGDGGWIYVSNSEMDNGAGGVGAVRFDRDGAIIDGYSILQDTDRNCAGGPTPWNTWLSCEEVPRGHVWECNPTGQTEGRELPALGTFNHEAVAVDPDRLQLYLTEDRPDGLLYRFTPDSTDNGRPDLNSGTLEAAEVIDGPEGRVSWHPVPDPSAGVLETRHQLEHTTPFRGGEGIWYAGRTVYFTTKYDNRVWAYQIDESRLTLIYDAGHYPEPVLTGVDNVTVSAGGSIYVAEDGGDMQIVAITPDGRLFPHIQIVGHAHSEVTGPAFDPSGRRLYFSSQRGATGRSEDGITYEVTGPFS